MATCVFRIFKPILRTKVHHHIRARKLYSFSRKMGLMDEIQEHFGTKNLYEVLNVSKDASENEIKKAYRKTSLKIHPDRVEGSEKELATRRFQTLAQVHHVLNDAERRKLYDDTGIIANEDNLDGEADWTEYWRLLFPKIEERDIDKFINSYIGSEEEETDLIQIYERYEGDLDKISQSMIGYDEERTTKLLIRLIEEGKISKYENFTNESCQKKNRRQRRAEREAKEAKAAKEAQKELDSQDDLAALIRRRNQGNFDSMIANLEAKYANGGSKKGVKRKRGD